ncbi:MAG: VirB8/TrbF family protein [Pseudomonadota bacterium]
MQDDAWKENQYHAVTRQRNILIILSIILIVSTTLLSVYIAHLANNAQKQVYIVQIDNNTGETQLVNNTESNKLFSNDAIALYFIEKYLHARENYSIEKSKYSRKLIQLFSSPNVFKQYIGYMYNEKNNLEKKYHTNQTYIKIKNKIKYNKNTYLIRFNLYNTGNKKFTKHAAIVSIEYKNMNLSDDDIKINPIGLQITEYKVNEEK